MFWRFLYCEYASHRLIIIEWRDYVNVKFMLRLWTEAKKP